MAPRLSVRTTVACRLFPSGEALPSTISAGSCLPLFDRFLGTTTSSDFSPPYMLGVRLLPSRAGPARVRARVITMRNLEQGAAWRTFEADSERAVHDTIYHGPGIYPDPKRLFGHRLARVELSVEDSPNHADDRSRSAACNNGTSTRDRRGRCGSPEAISIACWILVLVLGRLIAFTLETE